MSKFAKSALLVLILVLSIVMASCSSSTPVIIPTKVDQLATPGSGYPGTEQQAIPPKTSQAYPGPNSGEQALNSAYPKSVDVPEPKAGLGVVTGRLVEKGNSKVFLAPSLILGEMAFSNDPSAPPLVGFSQEVDPKGIQDQSGKFVFKDIKPGKYSIVIWTPGSQTLISDNKGNTVQITVEAGKVTDLGDVYVP